MSNNEMVSVPREAFKWAIEQLEEDGNKGCGYFDSLRALLDAPVKCPACSRYEIGCTCSDEPAANAKLSASNVRRRDREIATRKELDALKAQPQGEPVTEKHTYLMGYVHPQGKGRTFVIRNGPPTQEDIESIERLTEVRNNLSQVAITSISRIGNSDE